MGFSIRKKTKGKNSWLNLSGSSRGLHSSQSVKLGKNTTLNFSKSGSRITYNFGNGIRWTSSTSKKKSTNTSKNSYTQETQETQPKQTAQSNTDYTPAQLVICAIIAIIAVLIELYIKGS